MADYAAVEALARGAARGLELRERLQLPKSTSNTAVILAAVAAAAGRE